MSEKTETAAIDPSVKDEEFWDGVYGRQEQLFSGDPNVMLVEEMADAEPGTALDVGCGEGGDAIWLAQLGWRVTAADVSSVALGRAARRAESLGLADRIDWQQHELGASFPAGSYDLVTSHYLHSYIELPREQILRQAAAAVAPGGTLLIVGHAGPASWEKQAEKPGEQHREQPHNQGDTTTHQHGHALERAPAHEQGQHPTQQHDHPHDLKLPTAQEVLESLHLPPGQWEVLRSEEFERTQKGPDGQPGTRLDNVLKLRRTPPSTS
ncbi:MAG: class I SAM-dependent methyltransferase [Chloroflexota bacterium]